jgi:hypothetical protein
LTREPDSVSREALEAVIGRALLDCEYRYALFADPEGALAGYDLTAAERAALRSVDAENLDACASGVGARIRRTLNQAGRAHEAG